MHLLSLTYPLVDSSTTMTMFATATTQVINVIENLEQHQGYLDAEAITGIHLEIDTIPTDQGTEKLALLVASGEFPDIFRGVSFANGDLDAYENEVIIDLTPYLEEYAPNYSNLIHSSSAIAQNVCTDEGYHLSFYRVYQENGKFDQVSVTQGLLVRQDLLDSLKLDAPSNITEIENVLTQFKQQAGLSDPMLLQGSITTMGDSLIGAYGIGSAFYVKEGQVLYGPMQSEFKDYMKLLNRWYNNGILNADFYSYSTNPNDDVIISKIISADGVGLYFDSASNMETRNNIAADQGVVYAGLANPVGSDGKYHFGLDAATVKSASYYVSARCENPELAVAWNDFWYSDQGILITNYGHENITFTYDDAGQPHWTDYITNNPDGWSQGVCRQAYLMYTVHGICINDNELNMLDGSARQAVDVWTSSSDRSYLMPSVSYTSDESTTRAGYLNDIETLNSEVQLKMVVGELDVDEYWEFYQQTLREMHIEEVLDIMQAASDRFYDR